MIWRGNKTTPTAALPVRIPDIDRSDMERLHGLARTAVERDANPARCDDRRNNGAGKSGETMTTAVADGLPNNVLPVKTA
ncbi:hypothetical protein [Endobacterium cereale]|uniref:hypothetical protein n=1 Tax=Endobacterium cereale TaxID=2663029 RepID=UPI001AD950CF|nr:hypothetical protein [Endobacterium cereale]MEB2842823.1 hypothetical protein [Endobacterium cereale]